MATCHKEKVLENFLEARLVILLETRTENVVENVVDTYSVLRGGR